MELAKPAGDDVVARDRLDQALDALAAERLVAMDDGAVLVLPAGLDGSIGRYRPSDVYAVKDLRRHGVVADFLHAPDDRVFLHEHSSETVLAFSIGVGSSLSATGIAGILRYVYSKAKSTDEKDEPEQRIRIELRRYRRKGLRIRRVVIEGPASEATRQLHEVLGEPSD